MKNKNVIHIIYKNFSCVDFYYNIYLSRKINCKFIITDLRLLRFSKRLESLGTDVVIPFPIGKTINKIAVKNNFISDKIIHLYIRVFKHNLSLRKIKKTISKNNFDSIFVDQREIPSSMKFRKIFNLINKSKIKVFSIPHAPHYRNPNNKLNIDIDNITHLTNTINTRFDSKKQIYVGYPNFAGFQHEKIYFSKDSDNVLIMFRYFDRENDVSSDDVNDIEFILSSLPSKFNYIINPHPSLSKKELEKVVRKSGVKRYSIVETIPQQNFLFCLSTYTTVILKIINYRIPILFLKTRSFEYMMNWDFVDNLYSDLNGFCRNQNEFKNLLENIDDTISNYDIDYNLEILEKYYRPNSQEKFIDLL